MDSAWGSQEGRPAEGAGKLGFEDGWEFPGTGSSITKAQTKTKSENQELLAHLSRLFRATYFTKCFAYLMTQSFLQPGALIMPSSLTIGVLGARWAMYLNG